MMIKKPHTHNALMNCVPSLVQIKEGKLEFQFRGLRDANKLKQQIFYVVDNETLLAAHFSFWDIEPEIKI